MGKCGRFLILFCAFFVTACASKVKHEIQIPRIDKEIRQEAPKVEAKPPDFRIENEPLDPLALKRVSINVRNVPLRDILLVVCRDVGLNLMIDKDVDQNTPVTISLQNVTFRDALDGIISATDYFYTIERNLLHIKAKGSKIFHLNITPVLRTFSMDVGGDILGGVTTAAQLRGSVTKTETLDETAYKIWDSIEEALSGLLGKDDTFIINRLAGTIMVTASKRALKKVEEYIENLKRILSRQVTIEAKVIEVVLNSGFSFGIDWSFLRQWTHGSHRFSIQAQESGFSGFLTPGSPVTGITFSFASTTVKNFEFIIKALSQFGDIRTLSNPRISVLNGQPSLLTVGRNFTFISRAQSSLTTAQAGTPVITYSVETSTLLSGLTIGIVPYIGEDGEIVLTITPILSNVLNIDTKTFGTPGSQTIIQLPTVDLRELSTMVRVKDEEIVVIGGLMKKEERFTEYKTPVLGDLPLIGGLFRGRDKQEVNTELVILIQPRITR